MEKNILLIMRKEMPARNHKYENNYYLLYIILIFISFIFNFKSKTKFKFIKYYLY